MIVAVASGKGGTGKTLVSTGLALSLKTPVQFLDCDVEEPNASIFLKPEIKERKKVYFPKPIVEESHCIACGKCSEICQYNAIAVVKDKVLFFYELCHSCGACSLVCPEKAIFEVDSEKGVLEGGYSSDIEFWQGKLTVGESSPTPLVKALKEKINNKKTVIIDSSPGTSCPVVEAVKDADFTILVTEPTPFGLNDLILAVEMTKKLNVPAGVVINRCDIGDDKVEEYCKKSKVPVLMKIPFDRGIAVSYSKGIPITKYKKEYIKQFRNIIELIKKIKSK